MQSLPLYFLDRLDTEQNADLPPVFAVDHKGQRKPVLFLDERLLGLMVADLEMGDEALCVREKVEVEGDILTRFEEWAQVEREDLIEEWSTLKDVAGHDSAVREELEGKIYLL